MTALVDQETGEILGNNESGLERRWAATINESWRSTVDGILRTATLCVDAILDGCDEATLTPCLTFSATTFSRLHTIGNQANRFLHVCNRLPPHWGTLYEFTKLSDEQWALAETTGGRGGMPLMRPDVERKEVTYFRNYSQRGVKPTPPPLPFGTFDLIYADPPWRYEHAVSDSRAIENQYPTMELQEIRDLRVGEICADHCVLFLWTTSPKLHGAMSVLDSWGFSYKTCAVWDKQRMGMGYYFRQRHELLLVATRGNPPAPKPEDRPESIIRSPREAHSKKPEIVRAMIERMYPNATRVELFAREESEGWARWGNQSV